MLVASSDDVNRGLTLISAKWGGNEEITCLRVGVAYFRSTRLVGECVLRPALRGFRFRFRDTNPSNRQTLRDCALEIIAGQLCGRLRHRALAFRTVFSPLPYHLFSRRRRAGEAPSDYLGPGRSESTEIATPSPKSRWLRNDVNMHGQHLVTSGRLDEEGYHSLLYCDVV